MELSSKVAHIKKELKLPIMDDKTREKRIVKDLISINASTSLTSESIEGIWKEIFSWSNKELTEFYPVEATGHTFDIKHPFEGSNPKFDFVLNKTEEFFTKNLN